MDEFDFLNEPKQKPTKFIEFYMNKSKNGRKEEQKKELENPQEKNCSMTGYSRTKVLACKPKDREI